MPIENHASPTARSMSRRDALRRGVGSMVGLGLLAAGRDVAAAHEGASATPAATPNAPGPAMPPEITQFATDWPVAQGDLAARRAAAASAISAATVDRLDVAWTFPLEAVSGYGAVTANPMNWVPVSSSPRNSAPRRMATGGTSKVTSVALVAPAESISRK